MSVPTISRQLVKLFLKKCMIATWNFKANQGRTGKYITVTQALLGWSSRNICASVNRQSTLVRWPHMTVNSLQCIAKVIKAGIFHTRQASSIETLEPKHTYIQSLYKSVHSSHVYVSPSQNWLSRSHYNVPNEFWVGQNDTSSLPCCSMHERY